MTTNRGGRPAVGPMISLRFPADLLAQLDVHAQRTGTTRSDLLRRGAEQLLTQETTMTITDSDITTAVAATLGEHADAHDVDAIVRDIINRYGRINVDTIDHDEYWTLVEAHTR